MKMNLLSLTGVCSLLAAVTPSMQAQLIDYQNAVNSYNPVSYYSFEGNGNDGATGPNAGSNNATNVGTGPTYTSTGGFTDGAGNSLGQMATFPTDGNSLSLGANNASGSLANDLLGAPAITMMAWVDFASVTDAGSIFGFATSGTVLQMRASSTGFAVAARSTSADLLHEATYFSNLAGTKALVTGVLDFANDEIRLYTNSTLRVTTTKAFSSSTWSPTPLNANAITLGPGLFGTFNGNMDEFAIFGYALSTTQVSNIYSAIPEPSAAALMGLAGLGLVVLRRRRSSKALA